MRFANGLLRRSSFLAIVLLLTACIKKNQGGAAAVDSEPLSVEVTGNPFLGVQLYVATYTNADQARRRLERDNPAEAQLIAKIADTPQARWLGEWSGDAEATTRNLVKAARQKNQVPLLVLYNIPNRDCGQHSAGGAARGEAYAAWVQGVANGIGSEWRAIVVLEPDALGLLTQCLDDDGQARRLEMLRDAVTRLRALPGVAVYIDAGHSRWATAEEMAKRLKAAGVRDARGFALNTSNFRPDAELIAYGNQVASLVGGDVHYVLDTSRNGNGPAENDDWCNPPGRALGRRPAAANDGSALDAYVWLKNPGESDGECNGGPPAGQWFHERAIEMARNAAW